MVASVITVFSSNSCFQYCCDFVFVVNDGGGNIGDGIWKRSEFGQNGERFCFVCENGTHFSKNLLKQSSPTHRLSPAEQ